MVILPSHGFLDFASDELVEADVVDFDDFETDAGDVTVGSAHAAADAFDDDFVVFIDEADGVVAGGECGDLSSVFNELDFDAFADSGVGLFGFDADFFDDDAFCLGHASEWVCLLFEVEDAAFVVPVAPAELFAGFLDFSCGVETFSHYVTFIEVL